MQDVELNTALNDVRVKGYHDGEAGTSDPPHAHTVHHPNCEFCRQYWIGWNNATGGSNDIV